MDNSDQIELAPKSIGKNSSCNEVLRVLEEHGLPVSTELRDLMAREDMSMFAQVSGVILRTGVIGAISSQPSSQIFEISSARLKGDVTKFVELNAEGSEEDRQTLIELELAEQDNSAFYDFSVLLNPVEFSSEGASLLWRVLRSTVQAEPDSPHSFTYDKNSMVRWDKGQGFEKYFTDSWLMDQQRVLTDNNSVVYLDSEGLPVFYRLPNVNADNPERKYDGSIALSLQDITVNGVLVPAGTLVGVESDNNNDSNRVLPAASINSIFPLRLSLFSLAPAEARISFGDLYREYERNRGTVPRLENFREVALKIIDSSTKDLF